MNRSTIPPTLFAALLFNCGAPDTLSEVESEIGFTIGPVDSAVIEVASLNELTAIHRPSHALALCPRSMPPALTPWLDALPGEMLPNERLLVRVGDAPAALAALFGSSPLSDSGPARMLRDDMVDLIEHFTAIAGAPEVDVRVQHIRRDACKKFHRDHVRLRLISCYHGPTTEWVPAGHTEEALDHQKAYAGPLQHFPRFAVAVFKGHEQGVVHRSPAIASEPAKPDFCFA